MQIVKRHRSGAEAIIRALPVPPRRRRLPAWLIGVLAGLAVVGLGTAVEHALRARRPAPPVVLIASVTRGPIAGTVQASGLLEPEETTVVSQPIAGHVVEVLARPGDRVVSGQPLARFDPLALRAHVARTRARLVAAGVAAIEAEMLHGRTGAALEDSQDPSAQDDLEDLDLLAEAGVARAEAELAARGATYRVAAQQLRQRTVRASASGVVMSRELEPGRTVAAGAPLFTIASDVTRLRLVVEVPEADMARIAPDQRAELAVPAFRGRAFPARVVATGTLRGPAGARRLAVTLALENPDHALSPGMTASVRIATRSDHVFRAPVAALDFAPPHASSLRDEPAVWLVDRGGTALTRAPVEVGVSDGVHAEISGPGLHEGAAVAVGLGRLQEPQR